MKKILVTGGAGYIGSVMVPQLLLLGHEVTVIDNFSFNQLSLLDVSYNKKLNIIRGDINNESMFKEQIKIHDVIIPLAAIVGAPACNQNLFLAEQTNTNQIKTIVNNTSNNQQIIFPVTNSGYGIGAKDKYCDENTPLSPISFYGKSKVNAESMLLEKGNAITYRLATVFGTSPRMRMDLLVNDFVYRAVKDRFIVLFESHFKRNYIHIRDIAEVFIHGLNNYESLVGEPYNVGLSDANISKKELCERIKSHVSEFHIIENDMATDPDKRDYIVSNEKIESTGWKPQYSLDDGIAELVRTYSWLKTNQFSNV